MEIAGADAELPEIRRRARIFALFVVVDLPGRGGRLFYVQVIEGDAFYKVTSDSIVRTVLLPAVRGEIRDRKSRVLARMRPAANVSVMPRELTPRPSSGCGCCWRCNRRRRRSCGTASRPNAAIRAASAIGLCSLREDIARNAQAVLEETALELPGVRLEHAIRRDYPYGALSSHVLGYMNEITADEVRAKKQEGYRPGDLVGRIGVERQLEGYLRGRSGIREDGGGQARHPADQHPRTGRRRGPHRSPSRATMSF